MSSKKAILIMNRLIINADDFGIHQEVNRAVAIGFDTGILRSTSLLASGPAFPEAVTVAKKGRAWELVSTSVWSEACHRFYHRRKSQVLSMGGGYSPIVMANL